MLKINTLLIIKDSKISGLFEKALNSLGHKAEIRQEPDGAFDVPASTDFRLIIIDGSYDEPAVLSFMRKIKKKNKEKRAALVLILSPENRSLGKYLKAGMHDYIENPLSLEKVKLKIKNAEARLDLMQNSESLAKKLFWYRLADNFSKHLFESAIGSKEIDEISFIVLEHAKRLTGSSDGLIGFVHPKTGNMMSYSIIKNSRKRFGTTKEVNIFNSISAPYRRITDRMKALIENSPSENTGAYSFPEKHINIERFIYVPIFEKEIFFGMMLLANAESDYDEQDLSTIEFLVNKYSRAIDHRLKEESIEEQKEFLDSVLNAISYPLYVIDVNDYKILKANYRARETGINENMTCFKATHNNDESCTGNDCPCPIELVIKNRKQVVVEHHHKNKNGTFRIDEVHAYPIIDQSGKVSRVIEYAVDVTEKRKAEIRIRETLHEKELLLKEVHHRVKNNLQIISSLLNLQAGYFEKDKRAQAMFRVSQDRIRAMALIHEKLNLSRDQAVIDLEDYLQNLTANLFRSYQIDSQNISCSLDVEDISLDIDSAIPCGLIINELVSNSLKHAFKDREAGKISIKVTKAKSSNIKIVVKDNGIGLNNDISPLMADSLGLKLVQNLVEQLKGKLDFKDCNGALFTLSFNSYKNR